MTLWGSCARYVWASLICIVCGSAKLSHASSIHYNLYMYMAFAENVITHISIYMYAIYFDIVIVKQSIYIYIYLLLVQSRHIHVAFTRRFLVTACPELLLGDAAMGAEVTDAGHV